MYKDENGDYRLKENGFIDPITITPPEDNGFINPIYFIESEDKEKNSEEKKYLILYIYEEDGKEYRSFEYTIGRKATYEFLKNFIVVSEYIDIDESQVLVEGCKLEEALSVLQFMEHMEQFFVEDNFGIRDYYPIEDEDEEVKEEEGDNNA